MKPGLFWKGALSVGLFSAATASNAAAITAGCDSEIGTGSSQFKVPFNEFQTLLDTTIDVNGDGAIRVCIKNHTTISNPEDSPTELVIRRNNIQLVATPGGFDGGLTQFRVADDARNVNGTAPNLDKKVTLRIEAVRGVVISGGYFRSWANEADVIRIARNAIVSIDHSTFLMLGSSGTAIHVNNARLDRASDLEFFFQSYAELKPGCVRPGCRVPWGIWTEDSRVSAIERVEANSSEAVVFALDSSRVLKIADVQLYGLGQILLANSSRITRFENVFSNGSEEFNLPNFNPSLFELNDSRITKLSNLDLTGWNDAINAFGSARVTRLENMDFTSKGGGSSVTAAYPARFTTIRNICHHGDSPLFSYTDRNGNEREVRLPSGTECAVRPRFPR